MGWYRYIVEWFDESKGKYIDDDWYNTFVTAMIGVIRARRYHKIVRLTFRYRGGYKSGK